MKKITCFMLIFTCFQVNRSAAQVSGVKTVPGDYATVAAAVTALNNQGLSGAVTVLVNAGHTETATSGGIVLGSSTLHSGAVSLNATRTLTIRKNGSGANPLITAFTPGSGVTDGIFILAGSDYVTIDGIDLQEHSANTTGAQQMEWGYALLKSSAATPFNGCNHVIIKNSTITLNKTNVNSVGIYGGNHISGDITPLTITAIADAHSDNIFSANTIQNVQKGIELNGFNASAGTVNLYDQRNLIGGNSLAEGNTIRNFGRTTGTVTDIVSGIFLSNQNGAEVGYNTIDNLAGSGTVNQAGALHGIYHSTGIGSVLAIHDNSISLTQDSTANVADFYPIRTGIDGGTASAVTITGNTITVKGGYGGYFAFIYHQGALLRELIRDNIFKRSSINSFSIYVIRNVNATLPNGSMAIRDNKISEGLTLRLVGGSGKAPLIYGIHNSGDAAATSQDTISGNMLTGVFTNMTTNNIYRAIYDNAGTATAPYPRKFIYENRIGDLTALSGSSLQSHGIVISKLGRDGNGNSGIYNNTIINTRLNNGIGISVESATGQTAEVYGNRIDSCSDNVSNVTGIKLDAGDTIRVFNNIIRNITTSGATSKVTGIQAIGGLYTSIFNNTISELETPASGANPAITGIDLAGGAFLNIYHNTLRLHPAVSSAALFGLAGIYFNGTPIEVDIRNNIVNINATAKGKGMVSIIRRDAGIAGALPGNLSTTTNGNVWHVNSAPYNYLYVEGADTGSRTNGFMLDSDFNTPCNSWKKFMSPAESNSFTEDNLAATGSPWRYIPAGASYAKARALALATVTTDYDNLSRPTRADAGFLQFSGSVIPAPEASFAEIISLKNSFCAGDSLTIRVSTYPGMNYQWQKNNVNIPGATDTLLTVSASGSYTIVANSGSCADTSAAMIITAHPLPVPVITTNDSMLTAGGDYTSWQWYRNDTIIALATDSIFIALQSGRYTVAVTDTNGCPGISAAKEITVNNGIEHMRTEKMVQVYPNPVSGKLFVIMPQAEKAFLSLSNIAGVEVMHQDHVNEMDISTLAAGLYILRVTDKNGVVLHMEKVIKANP